MPEELGFPEFNIGTDPEAGCVYKKSGHWRSLTGIFTDPTKTGAIGLDGQRHTASLEFRPGIQKSSEILVHRLFDLVNKVRDYYHPPGISYRTGAWVDPEPLGGHVHFSWANMRVTASQVHRLLTGLNVTQYRLIAELFPPDQLEKRRAWAISQQRDYAKLGAYRAVPHKAGTIAEVIAQQHIEYRYTPSWMLSPEMAYLFLSTAETVARMVLLNDYSGEWDTVVTGMLEGDLLPEPGAPSIREAYQVTKRNLDWYQDFTDNWLA